MLLFRFKRRATNLSFFSWI